MTIMDWTLLYWLDIDLHHYFDDWKLDIQLPFSLNKFYNIKKRIRHAMRHGIRLSILYYIGIINYLKLEFIQQFD